MTAPGNLESARTALAAASAAPDPEVGGIYVALARVSLEKAKADLRALETVLIARERELVHRAGPLQTALPVAKGAP